jgi:predicted nuclease of predicted toxin-antitoxin system
MARYLIDVNLPYYFSLWRGPDYVHVRDVNDEWSDAQVWDYALKENLTIVSKDTDFSDRALLAPPPPRVIHIKIGNMRMQAFHRIVSGLWTAACELSTHYRLVRVFEDRLEGID